MDAKKLMNHKNYIMKHNKITEMEMGEMKRELQASQRSHHEERGEEALEHPGTMGVGEQPPNIVLTTKEKTEINQHQIHNLRRKMESTYYQVTQRVMDNRSRLKKLHSMSKLKVIMKMANKAMEELLDQNI
jgi:hypothetical protein